MKPTAWVIAAVSVGALATAAQASPVFTWDLQYQGDNGNGTYHWQATLHNATIDGTADDSGVAFTVPTGGTTDIYISGGAIDSSMWEVLWADTIDFYARAIMWEGHIDPPALDPGTSTMYIDFDSPYGTTTKGTIDVELDDLESGDMGHYFITNADVPGVPEPATIALMALGGAMMLTRARRKPAS